MNVSAASTTGVRRAISHQRRRKNDFLCLVGLLLGRFRLGRLAAPSEDAAADPAGVGLEVCLGA